MGNKSNKDEIKENPLFDLIEKKFSFNNNISKEELKNILQKYNFKTEVIAASVRSLDHVENIANVGSHIATIPGTLFPKLWSHPLTDKGIAGFLKDWEYYEEELKNISSI